MNEFSVKKPTLRDIIDIQSILEPYVKEGIILRRDDDEVASNIWGYEFSYNSLLRAISSIFKKERNEEKGILLIIEDKFKKASSIE